MRRALQTILFCIFACSAAAAALIGYSSTDWITRQLIARNIETTQKALRAKFAAFDVLLENEEQQMERRMAAALPVLAKELLGDEPSFARRSTGELGAISRRLGVDNIYIIDRNTVVVATDFAVSGVATMIDDVLAEEAGFFAHLTKPFKIQDARDTLRRALEIRNRAPE